MKARPRALGAAVVAAGVLAAYAGEAADSTVALSLDLIPTKRSILVDEPLVVTLLATGRGEVYFGDEGAAAGPHVLIESEGRSQRYVRKAFVAVQREPPRKVPLGRRPLSWDVVLGVDHETSDWAFPRAGRYRLTAVYDEPGVSARSDTVDIQVREPQGAEAEAHEALRPFRGTLLALAVNERTMPPALAPLATRHPVSAYLYLPRAYDMYERLRHAGRGVDPGAADRDRQGDVIDAARRKELSRRYYGLLRPEASELAAVEGPLQPDLMLRLAALEQGLGDAGSEKAILRKVARAFPHRPAGQRAAQKLKSLEEGERILRELGR